MTQEQMQAEIERLKAENSKLVAKNNQVTAGPLTMRVSQKGALSVYGLGRFPVTLFKSQWKRLLSQHADITAFIAANDSALTEKSKEDKAA